MSKSAGERGCACGQAWWVGLKAPLLPGWLLRTPTADLMTSHPVQRDQPGIPKPTWLHQRQTFSCRPVPRRSLRAVPQRPLDPPRPLAIPSSWPAYPLWRVRCARRPFAAGGRPPPLADPRGMRHMTSHGPLQRKRIGRLRQATRGRGCGQVVRPERSLAANRMPRRGARQRMVERRMQSTLRVR
jgi:hypothetical protein